MDFLVDLSLADGIAATPKKWRALTKGLPKLPEIFRFNLKCRIFFVVVVVFFFFLFPAVFRGFQQLPLRGFSWDGALWRAGSMAWVFHRDGMLGIFAWKAGQGGGERFFHTAEEKT